MMNPNSTTLLDGSRIRIGEENHYRGNQGWQFQGRRGGGNRGRRENGFGGRGNLNGYNVRGRGGRAGREAPNTRKQGNDIHLGDRDNRYFPLRQNNGEDETNQDNNVEVEEGEMVTGKDQEGGNKELVEGNENTKPLEEPAKKLLGTIKENDAEMLGDTDEEHEENKSESPDNNEHNKETIPETHDSEMESNHLEMIVAPAEMDNME